MVTDDLERYGRLFDWFGHLFTQLLENFPSIIIKSTINLSNVLVLNNPQLAVCVSNKPFIVTNNNNSWKRTV